MEAGLAARTGNSLPVRKWSDKRVSDRAYREIGKCEPEKYFEERNYGSWE